MYKLYLTKFTSIIIILLNISCENKTVTEPLRVIIDLDVGESRNITLSNGEQVVLILNDIIEVKDSIRNAIRQVKVNLKVDGEEITIGSGNYNLPVTIGKVKIDCPVTKGYYKNSHRDTWNLKKDARMRIWPKDSPFMMPESFIYPIKQKWFAGMTQSGNEPSWLGWGEDPENKAIYYHNGHDIGGAEGLDEIIAATDGIIVSAKNQRFAGIDDLPGDERKDVVYIRDNVDWYYRYSHLDSIYPEVKPGAFIKKGERLGLIGKQGGSGGWVHLHFGISFKNPDSNKWLTEDAYVYLWESYINQYKPHLIANTRPHQLLLTNQVTVLDARKSEAITGNIVSYEWSFSDGTAAKGPVQKRKYVKPGLYSEILKITDNKGNVDYDFSIVHVLDRENPTIPVPVLQVAYHPTLDIKTGDSITFLHPFAFFFPLSRVGNFYILSTFINC